MSASSQSRVSVIIPAFRAENTIGRAIDSVLNQSRPPVEILVIDDGSPDDLSPVLVPYREQVRLIRQPNGGAASARNRGIDLATGEFIAFLDADDYWEAHKLERQLEIVERHKQVGLVAAHYYIENPGKPREPHELPMQQYQDRMLAVQGPETLRVARKIWTSTVLLRRSILGAMRFDTSLSTAEDVDLWIRLVWAGPVYLLSEPLATAVLTPGSLSRSDVAADAVNMLAVLRRHAFTLGRAGVLAGKAEVYRDWAATHLGNGEAREAIRPAWKRLTLQPYSAQGWWILGKSICRACNTKRIGRKPRAPLGMI